MKQEIGPNAAQPYTAL